MNVLDFCSARGLQTQRVIKYIQRNPDLFEGHTTKSGQSTELDDTALKILEEKYPLPPEIIASPNKELLEQLNSAKDYIIRLQQEAIKQEKLLVQAQTDRVLLEERSQQMQELKSEREELKGENASLMAQIAELQAQLQLSQEQTKTAQREAESLRNRTFWQRIFNT